MSILAAILIFTSAVLHAGWNLISKRSNPSLAFFFIASLAVTVLTLPVHYVFRGELMQMPANVWALIAATGFAQSIYFLGLAGAYRTGDISFAYPLARALPVLFVASLSIIFQNGGEIGSVGLVGMVLITVGCLILPIHSFRTFDISSYFSIVCVMAFVAALGTTGYTLLDDHVLRIIRSDPSIDLTNGQLATLYISLETASTALMLGLLMFVRRQERKQLARLWRDRSMLKTAILTGVVIAATYGLTLAAMALVTNVSYVAAFRQLSIPIGAVLGMTVLHEPRYVPKIAGVTIVSLGLILVGFG